MINELKIFVFSNTNIDSLALPLPFYYKRDTKITYSAFSFQHLFVSQVAHRCFETTV